jgi:hypothetical protein
MTVNIMNAKIDFEAEEWKGISKLAKDFCRRLLNPNP